VRNEICPKLHIGGNGCVVVFVAQIGWLDDSDADPTPTVSGEFHQISQKISRGQENAKPTPDFGNPAYLGLDPV